MKMGATGREPIGAGLTPFENPVPKPGPPPGASGPAVPPVPLEGRGGRRLRVMHVARSNARAMGGAGGASAPGAPIH